MKNLTFNLNLTFFRRLVEFYKPTLNFFSKIELENPKAKIFAKIGCHLIDFLVSRPQVCFLLTFQLLIV